MKRETSYEAWMKQEDIPIIDAYGVEDVSELPRKPWARTGGKGAFIQLRGMEGFTGMYVSEIPPAGALHPEKHLYEELIYVLQGTGSTEVWSGKNEKAKLHFEWQAGSLFAVPLNCWHRLYNGSRQPALFLSATSAPMMMDLLHDTDFIFGCDYIFDQRFDGQSDYFVTTNNREERGGFVSWETNFIADARSALVDPSEAKGAGVRITSFDMGGSTLVGHLAEWPVGRYHKAHFHQGGAVLLILRSQGYTLMWPQESGERPYRDGRANQMIKVDWREGSVVSPPTGWFHQHFNTGKEKARQLAFRYSGQSGKYLLGIGKALNREGVRTNTRAGGTLLEYEDEDPQIRRDYDAALKKTGVAMEMPPLTYRGL
ncbi:MAG TPA: cupin domain-containing protein [Candidatus Binatia bacterium]|jgi:oxalate decarboxylase/phosphoglucose isomerase-like protein (cupin superfamily)